MSRTWIASASSEPGGSGGADGSCWALGLTARRPGRAQRATRFQRRRAVFTTDLGPVPPGLDEIRIQCESTASVRPKGVRRAGERQRSAAQVA